MNNECNMTFNVKEINRQCLRTNIKIGNNILYQSNFINILKNLTIVDRVFNNKFKF